MVLNGLYEKHSNANSFKRGKEINLKKKINNFADKFWKPLKPIPARSIHAKPAEDERCNAHDKLRQAAERGRRKVGGDVSYSQLVKRHKELIQKNLEVMDNPRQY